LLGLIFFHDTPTAHVLAGAVLIMMAGVAVGVGEQLVARKLKLQSSRFS